jgi:hypothetical protein
MVNKTSAYQGTLAQALRKNEKYDSNIFIL